MDLIITIIITILPVVTKDLPISPRFTPYYFFIAMQVQHSYNSSTNGNSGKNGYVVHSASQNSFTEGCIM